MIWKTTPNIQELNALCQNCAVSHLGIEFTDYGTDWLAATLEVNERTTQPFGLLHGGVSAALAETVASAAALLCCKKDQIPVGKELTIQHLKPVKQGKVTAKTQLVAADNVEHIWDITLYNERQDICAISQLVLKVIGK
ncbi:Putative esterase HI_1161 [Phocoenobacter uteri]|uniref:Esterase HI_1161 n=1 Tax=Phocoenobacter uteri TaxID=146806 RepID=A0A379CB17_9PAST|nr:hotdog fold thioesterase [Phocoenobacter uteri]MDG6881442.1 esterase [Phocoenobacter uteri]SUB59471.1 Putative esterase HI_1161 [Phocoenobacter uteri]